MLYILLFYLLFLIVAMAVPTLRTWRATGLNPIVLPRGDTPEGFVAGWFRALLIGIGFYFALRAAGWLVAVGPIMPEAQGLRAAAGWGLLALSLVWVVAAQAQMGRSWRVGIDTAHRTELVAAGPFRFSRNPIFLGMMAQLLALFLLAPDALTLLFLASGYLLISLQIRLEEAHLLQQHGEAYRAYCARVRRWL